MLDISLDFFDHIFNKGKTDESGNTIKTRFETKEYSLDTIFIVGFIVIIILTFLITKFRNYLKKHYQKKYEKQNTIELQTLRNPRNIGNMYFP
jgi:heme/copper-type cytochrome/quinol oxidase subunit 2